MGTTYYLVDRERKTVLSVNKAYGFRSAAGDRVITLDWLMGADLEGWEGATLRQRVAWWMAFTGAQPVCLPGDDVYDEEPWEGDEANWTFWYALDDRPGGNFWTNGWWVRSVKDFMEMETHLARAIELTRLALAFGRVERATFHEDGVRPETDTDHTVMLGIIACDFAQLMGLDKPVDLDEHTVRPGLDLGMVAQLALVHDLVEARVGDTQTLVISAEERAAKEQREADALHALLDEFGTQTWIGRMLCIYEAQNAPEARYIRVLDKVMPKLTHMLNHCIAAREITDYAGFEKSHHEQAAKLKATYGDVAPAVHALLAESMRLSERVWRDNEED